MITTANVIGLYPNIPWEARISAAVSFNEQILDWLRNYAFINGLKTPPDADTFKNILELILFKSYISFKNMSFYKQVQGTAIGMCISVYFANTYMYKITKELVHRPPRGITSFLRHIDDLFIITKYFMNERLDDFFQKHHQREN